jgi:hypothetical protein
MMQFKEYEICSQEDGKCGNNCCIGSCFDQLYSVYVDGVLNVPNVTKLFLNALEFKNESSEVWLPVIEQSIETCSKLGKNGNF